MATTLNKPVTRRLQYTLYSYKGKAKGIKVTVTPEETFVFSIAGTRHKIEVSISHCLNLAEILTMNAKYKDEVQRYKDGLRKRKPKRVYYPYSEVYLKSIETIKII